MCCVGTVPFQLVVAVGRFYISLENKTGSHKLSFTYEWRALLLTLAVNLLL